MKAKTFEVRDAATFIPVLAVKLSPATDADRYLFARAGYGTTYEKQARYVTVMRLAGGIGHATCMPHEWGGRTMRVAHEFILTHFDTLDSGAVVDVEHILGISAEPKRSERETEPL